MNKLKVTLLLLIALMSAASVWADEPFRRHRYDSWKVMDLPQDAIVFVGNSITDMHNWTEAFGNDERVVNRGNSGGYSFEVLDNVETWVRFRPAKVFIKIGTNDLGTNYNEHSIAKNIKRTVDIIRLESPETEIYLQSIIPAKNQNYKTLATIQATNVLIEQIAQQTEKCTYVNLYDDLMGVRTTGRPYSIDNLHLMAYGYKIWTEAIKDYVKIDPIYPDNTRDIQNDGSLDGSHGMRATYFSTQPTLSTDVLFFGDEMVKNGEWQELLHNQNIKNRGTGWGYGGDIATTSKIVDASFANGDNGVTRERPAQILLYTATGDINNTKKAMDAVQTEYAALVAKLKEKAPGTPIGLVSLMPRSDGGQNQRVNTFNQWLEQQANDDPDLTYINIYTALAQASGAPNGNYFSGDYIYGMGYLQVARKLAEFITSPCVIIDDSAAAQRKAVSDARATLWKNIFVVEDTPEGNGMAQYTTANMAEARTAVTEAKSLLTNLDADLASLQSAATNIQTKVNAMKANINLPQAADLQNKVFMISTPARGNLYIVSNGADEKIGGEANAVQTNYGCARWLITPHTSVNGAFSIQNEEDHSYLNPASAPNTNNDFTTSADEPEAGWVFKSTDALGTFLICSSANPTGVIMNMRGGGSAICNYSTNATTDQGCQWVLTDVTAQQAVATPTVPTDEYFYNVVKKADQLTDGWYRIRMVEPATTQYANTYSASEITLTNADAEFRQSNVNWYPVGLSSEKSDSRAYNYIYVSKQNGKIQLRSTNGHYLTASATAARTTSYPWTPAFSYGGFVTGLTGIVPWTFDSKTFLGKAGDNVSKLAFAPVPAAELTAQVPYTVTINDQPDATEIGNDARLTYTGAEANISGLKSVYNGGTMFFRSTPVASDFTAPDKANKQTKVTIDASAHTITVSYVDPEESLPAGTATTNEAVTTTQVNRIADLKDGAFYYVKNINTSNRDRQGYTYMGANGAMLIRVDTAGVDRATLDADYIVRLHISEKTDAQITCTIEYANGTGRYWGNTTADANMASSTSPITYTLVDDASVFGIDMKMQSGKWVNSNRGYVSSWGNAHAMEFYEINDMEAVNYPVRIYAKDRTTKVLSGNVTMASKRIPTTLTYSTLVESGTTVFTENGKAIAHIPVSALEDGKVYTIASWVSSANSIRYLRNNNGSINLLPAADYTNDTKNLWIARAASGENAFTFVNVADTTKVIDYNAPGLSAQGKPFTISAGTANSNCLAMWNDAMGGNGRFVAASADGNKFAATNGNYWSTAKTQRTDNGGWSTDFMFEEVTDDVEDDGEWDGKEFVIKSAYTGYTTKALYNDGTKLAWKDYEANNDDFVFTLKKMSDQEVAWSNTNAGSHPITATGLYALYSAKTDSYVGIATWGNSFNFVALNTLNNDGVAEDNKSGLFAFAPIGESGQYNIITKYKNGTDYSTIALTNAVNTSAASGNATTYNIWGVQNGTEAWTLERVDQQGAEVENAPYTFRISPEPTATGWTRVTHWYRIKSTRGYWWVSNAGGSVDMTSTEPAVYDETALWCVVGDSINGYRFYNKAMGTTRMVSYNNVADDVKCTMSETSQSLHQAFVINPSNQAQGSYAFHYDTDCYLNMRNNKLATWKDGAGANDGGSSFLFYEVTEAEMNMPPTATYTINSTTFTNYRDGSSPVSGNTVGNQARSNQAPTLVFKTAGANNQSWSSDGNLTIFPGGGGQHTFTLAAPAGYVIDSYTFTASNASGNTDVMTLTVNDKVYDTADTPTISSTIDESSITITENGTNNGVVLSDFVVTIKRDIAEMPIASTPDSVHWYYITNAASNSDAAYAKNKVIYYNPSNGGLYFEDKFYEPNHLWSFWQNEATGKWGIKSYSGKWMNNLRGQDEEVYPFTLAEAFNFFTITDTGNPYHAQNSNSVIVRWEAKAGGASLWRFYEVDCSDPDVKIASSVVQQGKVTTGIGNKNAPIVRSTISVSGLTGTLHLQGLTGTLVGDQADVDAVKVYFTTDNRELFVMDENEEGYDWRHQNGILYGQTTEIAQDGTFTVTGDSILAPGRYYVWVALDINDQATEGHKVDVRIDSYQTSAGTVEEKHGDPEHEVTIFLSEGTVLMAGDGKFHSTKFRIPAITTTADGKRLVTLTDDRLHHNGDLPNHVYITAQYSDDQGKTWSEPKIVAGEPETGGNYAHGDAQIITNRLNGDIIGIMTCATYNQGFWGSTPETPQTWKTIISHNGGETWEGPFDHTHELYGRPGGVASPHPDWKGGFSGSGAGLQLRNGTLVSPFVNRDENGNRQFVLFESTDGGQHWSTAGEPCMIGEADEPKVLERNNGDLAISVRASGYNFHNYTTNNGQTWELPVKNKFTDGIHGNACDGEYMVWCSTLDGNQHDITFQTMPFDGNRRNVSIALSTDEGAHFGTPKTICPIGSAYSAATVLDDGTLGVYYEEDGVNDGYTMRFVRFSLDWASDGEYRFDEEHPYRNRNIQTMVKTILEDVYTGGDENGEKVTIKNVTNEVDRQLTK